MDQPPQMLTDAYPHRRSEIRPPQTPRNTPPETPPWTPKLDGFYSTGPLTFAPTATTGPRRRRRRRPAAAWKTLTPTPQACGALAPTHRCSASSTQACRFEALPSPTVRQPPSLTCTYCGHNCATVCTPEPTPHPQAVREEKQCPLHACATLPPHNYSPLSHQ